MTKCYIVLTPCVSIHCPTPQRELSPILLKYVVTVHVYLFFNLSILGHCLLTSCSIINFTFLYPFNLVFLVLPPPNFSGSINILASISSIFIKILKYIQTSLSFHQCEHHIWCNHDYKTMLLGDLFLLPCQILTAPIMFCHCQGS